MTSLTTLSTISSFDRFAVQAERRSLQADPRRAGVGAPRRLGRSGADALALALLVGSVLWSALCSAFL